MLPEGKLDRAALARFQRLIRIDTDTGCWKWIGPTNRNGYGVHKMRPGGKPRVVHRIAYEHFREPIPPGLQVDHKCHTEAVARGECQGGYGCKHRVCCNPDHLELVTNAENTMRQDHHNRRKTHCPKGHEYTPENTRIDINGKRYCRQCRRES